jgi:osmotically-inducible protein OsmY
MKQLGLCVLMVVALSQVFCAAPVQNDAQDKSGANDRIQENLQSVFSADPLLSDANVHTRVDDQTITLTGTVQSYAQHQRVLQLVEPYSRLRQVVDKIKTPGSETK